MSIMQVITVTAITTNAEGQEVPNNTLVTFRCNERGYFVDSGGSEIGTTTIAGTYNGRATVKIQFRNSCHNYAGKNQQ